MDRLKESISKIFLLWILVLYCLFLVGCKNMWSSEFEFSSNNFNGGILAVNNDQALMLYFNKPKIELTHIKNDLGEPIKAVPKEEWMSNSDETLNRMTIEVLEGGQGKTDKLVFKELAQNGSWWHSSDLKTIYINTYWLDFILNRTIPENERIRKARRYKIFKSIDSGKTFTQLESWPSYRQVTQILFDDTGKYGYAIGGQMTIWRTSDGGRSWKQIQVPQSILNNLKTMSFDQRSDLIFDAYYFDPKSKDFYISNLLNENDDFYSIIYKLPWSTDSKENMMDRFKPILKVKGLNITDIYRNNNNLYMLGMKYDFIKKNYDSTTSQTFFLSSSMSDGNKYILDSKVLIDNSLQLSALIFGKDQVLYSSGVRNIETYPFQRDIAAVSFDQGRTWRIDEEGNLIQASYFDPKTNKVYMLKGGKVSSRELNKLNSWLP